MLHTLLLTFPFSTQAGGGLKHFLSYDEVKALSPADQSQYFKKVQEAFTFAEEAQKKNGVRLAGLEPESFLKNLGIQFFSQAEATLGSKCVFAGYILRTESAGGRTVCPRPHHDSCAEGQVPCNPTIFGLQAGSQQPYCIVVTANASKACSDASKNASYTAAFYMNESEKVEWDNSLKEIEDFCLLDASQGDVSACKILFKHLDMARFGQRDREASNCKKMPRLVKPSWAQFVLSERSYKNYEAQLNVKFEGPNSAEMLNKAQRCLDESSQYLKGPFAETLSIKLSGSLGMKASQSVIQIVDATKRANSRAWPSNIDCATITHETLHLLGLVDEYHEEWQGFRVDVSVGTLPVGRVDIPVPKVEVTRVGDSPTYADFDCRILGPFASIMSDHYAAMKSAQDGTNRSLLSTGQFNKILFSDCGVLNKTYDTCSKFAYQTSTIETRALKKDITSDCSQSDPDKSKNFEICRNLIANGKWLSGLPWETFDSRQPTGAGSSSETQKKE